MFLEQNRNLIIDPQSSRASRPLIDTATLKMTAALHGRKTAGQYFNGEFISHKRTFGAYVCRCGASVAACDFQLSNGFITNTLAVHVLAYHRDDIPAEILKEIQTFDYGHLTPSSAELL